MHHLNFFVLKIKITFNIVTILILKKKNLIFKSAVNAKFLRNLRSERIELPSTPFGIIYWIPNNTEYMYCNFIFRRGALYAAVMIGRR
jgi:hypothetical protein